MDLWDIVIWVGTLRLLYLVLEWVYFNLMGKIDIDSYKYGWIIVTGASDGIGKAICEVLAKRDFKIILVGRNKSKLEALVSELSSANSNPNIKYVVADFAYSHRSPEEFYSDLMKQFVSFEISGLINNVGVADMEFLIDENLEKMEEMLGINIYPQTLLSYHILPQFIERFKKTKQRSLLINFSSTADLILAPLSSVYSATKRYSDYLSEGIRKEYSHSVDVATVKPGLVSTQMTSASHGNGLGSLPFAVKASDYANYLIKNLHKGVNYGHWTHSAQAFLITQVPIQVWTCLLKQLAPWLEKNILVKRNHNKNY